MILDSAPMYAGKILFVLYWDAILEDFQYRDLELCKPRFFVNSDLRTPRKSLQLPPMGSGPPAPQVRFIPYVNWYTITDGLFATELSKLAFCYDS